MQFHMIMFAAEMVFWASSSLGLLALARCSYYSS